MFVSMQGSLFGIAGVAFDERFATLQRMQLDADAWIDYASMWLHGDVEILDAIAQGAPWEQPMVRMYDREVVTPRLVAQIDPSLHPVIPDLIDVLSDRYGVRLDRVSAGWYRNGDDSVAFHGDRIARDLTEAIVATVARGEPRRFLIRPKASGESHTLRYRILAGSWATMPTSNAPYCASEFPGELGASGGRSYARILSSQSGRLTTVVETVDRLCYLLVRGR